MNLFTPSRRVSHTALLAVIVTAIAIIYRWLEGNDPIALALGLLAILLGIVTVAFFYTEWRRQYQSVLKGSVRHGRIARRGRAIAIVGVVFIVGSFAWLGLAITLFGASPQHMLFFQIWLVLFLVGCAFLFFPVVVKWGITLGLIRSGNGDNR